MVSMRQWGERHLFSVGETHSVLLDNGHDAPLALLEVRSVDGKKIEPGDCYRRRVIKP